jgi:uncharacterized protein (DUF433 family)
MEQSESVLTSREQAKTLMVILEHIVSTPDTCGSAARVMGCRIRVQDIVV